MKKVAALFMFWMATSGAASARDWKPATIIGTSQTTVTSPMMSRPKIIMHYTVLTNEYTLVLDFTYHAPKKSDEPEEPGKNSPPSVPLGEPTKIAISGHHAYILDVSGKEVKMDIKKKTKN